MKRVVKYRKGYDMWTYVAGGKRLPGAYTVLPISLMRLTVAGCSAMECMAHSYAFASTDS